MLDYMVKDFSTWEIKWKNERAEKEKRDKLKEHSPSRNKKQAKRFSDAMKQDFLAAYEDSENE